MANPEGTSRPNPSPGGGKVKLLVLAIVVVGAGAALLYGMSGRDGKETASAGQCKRAAAVAERVKPHARGDVAALAVHKTPRPATSISFLDPDGKKIALSQFQGKTVLLNLWATWCAPCRAEMPALDRLQASLGSEKFEVVALNIDTSRLERRKPFLDSVGVKNLKFYADPEGEVFQVLKRAGKVVGLPTTYLIGPDGCEIGRMAGPAHWDSDGAKALIRAALGEKDSN